jgi:putative DNA primase/helicase
VIIPPSVNATGGTYEWIHTPWEVPPVEIPDWLLSIVQDTSEMSDTAPLGEQLVEGTRNDSMFHNALMMARQGALKEFVLTTMQQWLEQSGVTDITKDEVERTVASAFNRVEKEKEQRKSQTVLKTDSDNASRLTHLYSDTIRYTPGVGWLVWDGRVWDQDDRDAAVINCATQSMVILREEALEKAKVPENFKTAISEAAWASTSLNIGRLQAAVSLASTRTTVRLPITAIDGPLTRLLLNTANGIVDLTTGELRPHDPSMLITKMVPVKYVPEARCPFWEETLQLAFSGDQRLVDYMQRALGYTLTGSTSEQCMFICWGEQGNNGKSTILETVQNVLGNYAQMSDVKVVTSPEMDNRVASSLAKLLSVRAVFMNEAEENQRFSEALIKQLTGGDTLQACKKFKEPFEYKPAFKLWVRTNEKPSIRGTSDAIWRRVKLIPFDVPIPAERRLSRDTVDDRLKVEFEGILAWLVRGAQAWVSSGLQDPDEVKAATAGYRTEMDTLQMFFDECVESKTGSSVTRIELYQAFSRWGKENGLHYVLSADGFGRRVSKKLGNPPRVKEKGQFVWQGIALSDYAKGFLYA